MMIYFVAVLIILLWIAVLKIDVFMIDIIYLLKIAVLFVYGWLFNKFTSWQRNFLWSFRVVRRGKFLFIASLPSKLRLLFFFKSIFFTSFWRCCLLTLDLDIFLKWKLISKADARVHCYYVGYLTEIDSLILSQSCFYLSTLIDKIVQFSCNMFFSTGSIHGFDEWETLFYHFFPLLYHFNGPFHFLRNAIINVLQSFDLVLNDSFYKFFELEFFFIFFFESCFEMLTERLNA